MTQLTISTKIYRDGREVCLKTHAGQVEYKRRREQMYERDKGMCCICGGKIRSLQEATFEHKNGRGMGGSRRDDRIEKNGVAHFRCNVEQGSKRYAASRQDGCEPAGDSARPSETGG